MRSTVISVVIVDPGISNQQNYEPYSYGLSKDVFIKDKNNNVFIGKVWPGNTAFPDFLNPVTQQYWQHEVCSNLSTCCFILTSILNSTHIVHVDRRFPEACSSRWTLD